MCGKKNPTTTKPTPKPQKAKPSPQKPPKPCTPPHKKSHAHVILNIRRY